MVTNFSSSPSLIEIAIKPDFLIFSAGFDAHKDDPLAQFKLNSKDFYEITRRALTATNEFTKGKVISILEGGYDLNALSESANEHVNGSLRDRVIASPSVGVNDASMTLLRLSPKASSAHPTRASHALASRGEKIDAEFYRSMAS